MSAFRKILASLLVVTSASIFVTADEKIDFVNDIKPILTTHYPLLNMPRAG